MGFIKKLTNPFLTIFENGEMIVEMSKKEIRDKYKGQPLGRFWVLFHPLVLIATYIFLFGVVYTTRSGNESQNTLTYAAYLLSGMVPWLCIQTALNGGSMALLNNSVFIKQVIFPTEVLPIKAVGAAFIVEIIYLVIDIMYCMVSSKHILWTYILLPYVLLIQIIFLIGMNYVISSVTVYLRDLKDVIQVLCTVGIYILPVIYTPDAVPRIFKAVIYVNPFSHFIWVFQDILYSGRIEHWYSWVISTIISLIMLYVGHYVFNKLRNGFGSAL